MLLLLFHKLLELYEIVMHEEAHFGISRKKMIEHCSLVFLEYKLIKIS